MHVCVVGWVVMGPVFVSLAVDRSNAGCTHAQTDMGVPIDELCALCTI